MESTPQRITQLLVEWSQGNSSACEELFPIVHAELRRMARRQMRCQQAGPTLQATARS